MNEIPKYYLADVPHNLRTTVLDRCCRRLYHEALELLQQHGFPHYTIDDLVNFYHWGPATLQPQPDESDRRPQRPRDYSQPSAEQLDDIRKRLADVSPDVLERLHESLKHGSIEASASLLWKAGASFTSAELYEYRKTLFPPNSMVDPYTADAPVLRKPAHPSADSLSASIPASVTPSSQESTPATIPIEPISPMPSASPELSALASTPETTAPDQRATDQKEPLAPPGLTSGLPLRPARKRRGKIASLPKDLREELNTRLEANQTYTTIMRWLARNGHPGFNKQNLHKWKDGGYQDWRRENERIQIQLMQREWLNEQVAQTKPGELFPLIDHLFVTQVLDSLFGLDTATIKNGLAAGPRHFISLFSAYNRFKRDSFLQQGREKNRGRAPTTRELYQSVGLRPPDQTVKDRQPSSTIDFSERIP